MRRLTALGKIVVLTLGMAGFAVVGLSSAWMASCGGGEGTPVLAQADVYRHHGPAALNDLTLTPGAVSTRTAAQLCSKDFHTGDVRSVSEKTKHAACAAYGIDREHCVGLQPDGSGFEIDHLVSLELGGTNDLSNLWPQPYNPKPGAKEKDVVENWLHAQVCAGKVDLATAQKQISFDWFEVYLETPQGAKN